MKCFYTSIFYFLIICSSFSQIAIDPGCLMLEADSIDQILIKIYITNNGTEEVTLYWEFEPHQDFPEDWKFQISDLNLNYAWNASQSVSSLGNKIEAGGTNWFYLKVQSNQNGGPTSYEISGSSSGTLKLYDNTDFIDPIAETSCVVSNTNIEVEDFVIYPNPTTDIIQLKEKGEITSIIINDALGRYISTFNHREGMVHDVSELRLGMYLVWLVNKDNEIVKTLRLSKM